ncbi:uncharacterized protein I303_104843 [Kwoniella dejecticola CBS 10117]|uniref:PB1 domain-containing protein n=1 Tax=Kwoniella dejecticola CBS 10117 TaxID=1296121 RepID=A0A1A6A470_9TREE|nr:uncharacterized protein I303_04175 [Kwoniella dejecticola CBS 10117]OBR84854.1 hypothetical protein I303_04175 [Kwoniella dejecticola CBS 10117]
MSLKAELTIWSNAIKSYDSQEFEESIAEFRKIADTSKILWNIGIILATLGNHKEAIEHFYQATGLDCYFAVGYHQAGVSNFMLGNYAAALKDFEDALLYLRGNQTINYEQLGLDFRLYSCEVLFNCGLSKIYLGQVQDGLSDLNEARTQKVIKEHEVIDDAIRDQGRDYNVFSVPVGVLFKPSQKKLKNLASRDYMGKAILVAATDVNDAYTTFTGITRLQRGQTPSGAPLDAGHPLGRSASVSAIPQEGDLTPIAGRMTRSNTVATAIPRTSEMGLGRSLSTSTNTRPLVKISTDLSSNGTQPLSAPTQQRRVFDELPNPRSAVGPPRIPSPLLQTPQNRYETKSMAVTEIYDDYYKSGQAFEDDIPIPPDLRPIGGAKRGNTNAIENWSNKTPLGASPSVALSRKGSTNAIGNASANANIGQNMLNNNVNSRQPPSAFNRPSGNTGGGLTRTMSLATSSRESNYEGASEAGSFYDMSKIRVKVNYGTHKRGMSIMPSHTYKSFLQMLCTKFPEISSGAMDVKFKDEDGDILSMRDEGDFEAAIDVARILGESAGRGEGRLEIWVD